MSVVLASDWGGSTVAGLVADTLAASQAVAAGRKARQIGLADLAVGLLNMADDAVSRVLEALPVDRERLVSELSVPAPTQVVPGLPEAGPDVLAVLARAPLWRGDSDDGAVGLRLLGEVAKTFAVEVQPLRNAGVGSDRLRWAAARCGIAYEGPAAPAESLRPPAVPTLAELRERTPDIRSAAITSVLSKLMPNNDSAGTPYGMVRARRWSTAHIIYLCVRPLTILAMIVFGIRSQSWWCLSSVLLLVTAEFVPLIVWVASYAGLALIAGLEFPWPFIVLVLVCAAADGMGFWYQWWMKRIDEGDPFLPGSAIRKGAMAQADHLLASWLLERARGR
jgi:hypothetical protein